MLCEKCQKNLATVRYAEVIDGKVKDLSLCPDCLTKQQAELSVGFGLSKPDPVPQHVRVPVKGKSGKELARERCKACGHTLGHVLTSGKTGCGLCYVTFSEQIDPLLRGMHGETRHRGKVPHVDDASARVRVDLQAKRALLRTILRAENYEEAAHLRDEIRVLENELSAPGRDN